MPISTESSLPHTAVRQLPPLASTPHRRLTVVIPTRNRPAVLRATLASIADQSAEIPALEVIVVDDGSDPPLGLSEPALSSFRLLRQPGLGPAAARNRGIQAARGERILLLGDDTAPAPGCLRRHAEAAEGLQGAIAWDPRREITPLMRFLAPEGPQYWFRGYRDGDRLPATALLGANYSAPRDWFRAEPFDERFRDAAFEDTELGWRFSHHGWRSRFESQALCWHDHNYSAIEPFLDKQRRAGRAARQAIRLHPRLVWRAAARPLAVYLAKRLGISPRSEPERGWERACLRAYLSGIFAPVSVDESADAR